LLESFFGLCYTLENGRLFALFFNMLRRTVQFPAGMAREDELSGDLRKKMKRKARRAGETLLVRTLTALAATLPRRTGLPLFELLGDVAWRCYPGDRRRAVRNVSLALPGTPGILAEAIARGSFKALGRNVRDALSLTRASSEDVLSLCSVSGEEHLRRAWEGGRGVVALTGHIGCWELLGAWCSARGYEVSVIASRLKHGTLDKMLTGFRARHGIETIHRGRCAVSGLRALERGGVLGILIDQDTGDDGVFTDFFGVQAFTPTGPAFFALRSGAAIVPLAIHMKPGGGHEITVMPEIEKPPAHLPEEERIRILTADCSAAVERMIRLYPQQWVWFHDRWRRRPEDVAEKDKSGYLDIGRTGTA